MDQRLFGLLLFAMQVQQAFAGFGSGLSQSFDAGLGVGNLRQARLRACLQFVDERREAAGFLAQHGDGLAL